jgi:excisionase family DNA binding protein
VPTRDSKHASEQQGVRAEPSPHLPNHQGATVIGRAVSERLEAMTVEPLAVRIAMAVRLTGISRSRIYELIEAGDLQTVKVGRSTLIPYSSLKALVGG